MHSMGWNATTQREWIVNNLGPTLESAGYSDVKLMILDDQRPLIPKWAREVFADEKALKYVSGIGVHWYADDIVPFPFALDQAHDEFPDKFLLYTEACNGIFCRFQIRLFVIIECNLQACLLASCHGILIMSCWDLGRELSDICTISLKIWTIG